MRRFLSGRSWQILDVGDNSATNSRRTKRSCVLPGILLRFSTKTRLLESCGECCFDQLWIRSLTKQRFIELATKRTQPWFAPLLSSVGFRP